MVLTAFPCPGTEPALRAQWSCLIRGYPCQRGWELEWFSLETRAKPSSSALTFFLRGQVFQAHCYLGVHIRPYVPLGPAALPGAQQGCYGELLQPTGALVLFLFWIWGRVGSPASNAF